MRKFLFGLGVITAVLIGFGAVSLFVLSRNGAALDAQSKSYVEDSVVSIATGWNTDELWKRASPHLRKMTTRDDLRRFLEAAKDALGPLVEYRGARGEAMMSLVNSTKTVSARYVAKG